MSDFIKRANSRDAFLRSGLIRVTKSVKRRKIRMLFVISQFVQGGAQRHLFEICKALDKNKFEIEILTRRLINSTDFYYYKLRDMGIVIHRRLPIPYYFKRCFPFLHQRPSWRVLMKLIHLLRLKVELRHFFHINSYDLINFIMIETYYLLQRFFQDNARLVIFLLNHRFQYNYDPYSECLPDRKYRFVLMDMAQQDELIGTPCSDKEAMFFPLAMNFGGRKAIPLDFRRHGPIKIGIFTRLSEQKPLVQFFRSFQSLLKDFDATLHIYGKGNPGIFSKTLDMPHVRNRIFFEGHRADLEQSLNNESLSLVWGMSYDSFVGYASIEIGSFGIPIVFWNFNKMSHHHILKQTGGAIYAFSTVSDFVEFNKKLLSSPELLQTIGDNLRGYFLSNRDIAHHISHLENYFLTLLEDQPR